MTITELDTPTNTRSVPMKIRLAKINAGMASRLRTRHKEAKFTYIKLNIPQLARLGLFSRSTQERGFASLFHLSTPGSLAGQVGLTGTWTVDSGAGAEIDFGAGLQERGYNGMLFTSQTVGVGSSYKFWNQDAGFQAPSLGKLRQHGLGICRALAAHQHAAHTQHDL